MKAAALFLSLVTLTAVAQQKKSDNTLSNTNPAYTGKYRRIDNYLVDANTPVKTIQLNFNIFTGPGTFQDTKEVRAWLNQTLAWVNSWYINNGKPTDSLPGVEWIPDTKIRFEVGDRIYFYNNTSLYNSCSTSEMEKVVKATDSTRMNYLNVYFTFGPCVQNAIAPFPGFDYYPSVGSGAANQFVLIPVYEMGYATSQTLAHELGHTLDLMHTYEASCCHETCDPSSPEFLDDLFIPVANKKCWHDGGWSCDPNSSSNTCTNNMMGGIATVSYYFSPKQIAKMHRALSIKSAKKYVKETTTAGNPVIVKGEEVWNFDMRLYSDVIVKKRSKLVIKGNITIPDNCNITVHKKGKLEIEGKVVKSSTGLPAEIRQRK